ncbi:DUF1294 domain-containing protein [Sulfitobacter sp.]|uniref:DUF1294 domain-containing protein n=1 Tax=Sulfitobacter sp. TaxID=1903071 RepID=UPI003003A39D
MLVLRAFERPKPMILLILLFAIVYFCVINVKTYRAFAADKIFAIKKEQRTPEAALLYLARIGGWGGAKIAQHRLRHKSSKQPFGHRLNMIGLLHAACVVTVLSVFGLLALVPPAAPVSDRTALATCDAQASPRAVAQLVMSLRPPAGRPAR